MVMTTTTTTKTETVAVEMVIQRMNNILFSGCNSSHTAVQHHEDHQTHAFIFYSPNKKLVPLLMYCFLKAFTYKG